MNNKNQQPDEFRKFTAHITRLAHICGKAARAERDSLIIPFLGAALRELIEQSEAMNAALIEAEQWDVAVPTEVIQLGSPEASKILGSMINKGGPIAREASGLRAEVTQN